MSTAVFPFFPGFEWPIDRTEIEGKTLIQTSVSGKENRAALWTYPRRQYSLSFQLLRDNGTYPEWRTLVAFVLARQGSFDSFLYADGDDGQVTGQDIGVGTGGQTQYQLVRSLGGFTEPVLAPHSVSTVYVNGTALSGSAWSVNALGGVVTFTSAPALAAVLTADFTYYWPCRFLMDQHDFSKFADKRWELKKLEFISLKNWP